MFWSHLIQWLNFFRAQGLTMKCRRPLDSLCSRGWPHSVGPPKCWDYRCASLHLKNDLNFKQCSKIYFWNTVKRSLRWPPVVPSECANLVSCPERSVGRTSDHDECCHYNDAKLTGKAKRFFAGVIKVDNQWFWVNHKESALRGSDLIMWVLRTEPESQKQATRSATAARKWDLLWDPGSRPQASIETTQPTPGLQPWRTHDRVVSYSMPGLLLWFGFNAPESSCAKILVHNATEFRGRVFNKWLYHEDPDLISELIC